MSQSSDNEDVGEEAPLPTIADDTVVTKYKTAAEITNTVLKKVIASAIPGANILALCELGDASIEEAVRLVYKKDKEMKKGIAFPTCVSVNNVVCHFSPLKSEAQVQPLAVGDLLKIDLGAHIDGFPAAVAHTTVVGAQPDQPITGRAADVICAANVASEIALRSMQIDADTSELASNVALAVQDFKCTLVENMASYQMEQNQYEGAKSLVLNPSDEIRKTQERSKFSVHEVWTLDILVSTGDGKSRESETRTTIYKRKTGTVYQLKMKSSRQFYSELCKKFEGFPFNLRAFEDERKARLGVVECANHDLVQPLSVLQEKEGQLVAQFKFTVLLTPNGPVRITGLPHESAAYQSEFATINEKVREMLLKPARQTKSAKHKAKKSALTANATNSKGGDE